MFGSSKDKTPICPLLKGECVQAQCMFWTHIRGMHPQTGAEMDMPDCAIKWLPVLLIESSKETRQAAAAVESLRNENVTTGQQITGALMQVAATNSQQLIRGDA